MHCDPNRFAQRAISSGSRNRGGVDRHLVGARGEHVADVLLRADPAADRERDEDLLGRVAGELDDRVALFVAGRDVEEHELVGALGVVAGGKLHGVPGVAETDEVHALHHPPVIDVQAGHHPDHAAAPPRTSSAWATVNRPS